MTRWAPILRAPNAGAIGSAPNAVLGNVKKITYAFQKSRPSATARGYGAKWQRESQAFLARPENRWCAACRRLGKRVLATEVDHVVAHRGNVKLFWDRKNWAGRCKSCHSQKTRREMLERATGKAVLEKGCLPDGTPIDSRHPWNG